jgi:hypothetical protein
MNYTVFFEQINRTNFQVTASNEHSAMVKAIKLYKKQSEIPPAYVQNGWLCKTDGENK